jgi:hypothetical protein
MRRLVATAIVVLPAFVATAPALGASQVGATFNPTDSSVCGGQTFIQTESPSGEYTVPSAGVITSWSFQADPMAPQLRLKFARPAGGADYTIVGQSALEIPTPSLVSSFPTRISVAAGDLIGFFVVNDPPCARVSAPAAYVLRLVGGDQQPGTTATYSIPVSNQQLDVSAVLESDCDSDGFGDETQDQDLAPCPPAPETTITKGPKDKTKKKQATFEFTANEPGATFECALDGKPFSVCTSPDTVKVKKGKHTFEVRAKDAGGNIEGTPASDSWKVKKKKK